MYNVTKKQFKFCSNTFPRLILWYQVILSLSTQILLSHRNHQVIGTMSVLFMTCVVMEISFLFSNILIYYIHLVIKSLFFSGKISYKSIENRAVWFHVPIADLEQFSALCLSALTFVNIIIIICISWPWLVFLCPFTFLQ